MNAQDFLTRYRRQRAGEEYLGTTEHGQPLYLSKDAGGRHTLIFGPTGGGKSRLAAYRICCRIDAGDSCEVVVDPHSNKHGSIAHLVTAHVYATHQEHRLIILDPETLPLHGLSAGLDPLARCGFAPSVQAGLAVETLKRMSGDGSAPTPLLVRWGLNTFTSLAAGDLPFATAERLLDPTDPTYRRFAARILAKEYPAASAEWLHLIDHEHEPRTFSDLQSLQNRVRALLSNECLRWTYATKRHVVDFERAARERAIVLVKCAPRRLMAKSEAKVYGLQAIEQTIKAAMNRPTGPRIHLTVDESPVFASPLMPEILDGGRGYALFFTLLAQSLNQFQDEAGGDYRFLSSVMNNARCRIIFGGSGPSDAETLAKLLWGPYLDPYRVKQELYRTMQLSHVEQVRTVTRSRAATTGVAELEGTARSHLETQADNWGSTTGRGRTHGWSHAEGTSQGDSETESRDDGRAYRRDILFGGKSWDGPSSLTEGRGTARSESTGASESDTYNDSDTESESESFGGSSSVADGIAEQRAVTRGRAFSFSESEVETPMVFPDEPELELSSREYMALSEQLYECEARLRRLPDQWAVLSLPAQEPIVFKTAFVPDPPESILELAHEVDRSVLHEARWAVPLAVLVEEVKERDASVRALLSPPATRPSDRRKKQLQAPELNLEGR